MDTAIIEQMDDAEKLHTMEQLWDVLCRKNTQGLTPSWHQEVLNDRIKLHESGEAQYLTLEEVRNSLT
jgi:hypothetical protein